MIFVDFFVCDVLLFGSLMLGEGELLGLFIGFSQLSWEEFLLLLVEVDFSGKVVVIFGFGDQKKYLNEFVDVIGIIYDVVVGCGVCVIGYWLIVGYEFDVLQVVDGDYFFGLVFDQINQLLFIEEWLDSWLI